MKNITFSVDEKIIEEARKQAAEENTNLNRLIREWLKQYAKRRQILAEFDRVMAKAPYFTSKRKFTRAEMNER